MDEKTLLRLVTTRFEEIDIAYMVTGAVAVSYYGVPRATHDIDLVVAVSSREAEKVSGRFHNDFYVSDILEAIRHRQMFNLIDQTSQIKVDCWVLDAEDAYHRVAFERRQRVPLWEKNVQMISKEDLILSKLLWYKESQSDVHLNDIKGILRVQAASINNPYIAEWAKRLSVEKNWTRVTKEE